MQSDSLLKHGEFDTWLSKLVMNTMETKDSNELLLDVIIAALKGYVETNGKGLDNDSEEARKSGTINFSYLLGQSIRQWQIPEENWHTSVAAMDVWRLLNKGYIGRIIKIKKDDNWIICGYKEKLPEPTSIKIPRFIGTTKDFSKITVDDVGSNNTKQYVFNDIFIAEHATPVSDIKDALEICYRELGDVDTLRESVRTILNKIHITQILKIEDRRINNCNSRIKEIESVKKKLSNNNNQDIKQILYEYLKSTEADVVYKELCSCSYSNLSPEKQRKKLDTESESYKKAKQIANCETWAKAVELESHEPYYTIKIYENGTNKELL